MTKKKKIIIIISVTILILFVIIANLLLPRKGEIVVPERTPVPEGSINIPSKFEIPEGETVETNKETVNNFFNENTQVNSRGDALIVNTENYHITYFSKEDQFLITILSSPFEEVRKVAEIDFIQTLGIDKETACKIGVIITTPAFANRDEAGKNYKLSFCENDI
jgi:hypothetical protein